MPKKFTSENTRAVAARARKAAVKVEQIAKKQQQEEEEFWRDDDKNLQKKLQRKEEKEKKKNEALEKKAISKSLLEQETQALAGPSRGPSKVTQAEIQERRRLEAAAKADQSTKKESPLETPLEENINRIGAEEETARSVTEAIAVLSTKEIPSDKHPERRMKAAFTEFEEANMPRIKAENPTLRLSQLKQILRKEWMKSPENPLNKQLGL